MIEKIIPIIKKRFVCGFYQNSFSQVIHNINRCRKCNFVSDLADVLSLNKVALRKECGCLENKVE